MPSNLPDESSSPDEIWLSFVRSHYDELKHTVERCDSAFFLYRNMLSSIWQIEMTPTELTTLLDTIKKYLEVVESEE